MENKEEKNPEISAQGNEKITNLLKSLTSLGLSTREIAELVYEKMQKNNSESKKENKEDIRDEINSIISSIENKHCK